MTSEDKAEIQKLANFAHDHVEDYDFDNDLTLEEIQAIPEDDRTEQQYYAEISLLAEKWEEKTDVLSKYKHGEDVAIKAAIKILTELVIDNKVDMLRITITEVEELINVKLKGK